jgi:hypothetical protein
MHPSTHLLVGEHEAIGELCVLHGGAAKEAQRIEHPFVLLDPREPFARRIMQLNAVGEDG